MNLLLTGYSGFVGSHILKKISNKKYRVKLLGRTKLSSDDDFYFSDFSDDFIYHDALKSVDVIIHCAARVHVMNEDGIDSLFEYMAINTIGTMNLARQAAAAGVKRFIFLSSIKVNGESTTRSKPFTARDEHNPIDPYGKSKAEAELQLLALGKKTGMEIVIIRPPLVYGVGVKANFSSLMNLVSKGIPLPFRSITGNRRSLVSVDNLVDLIVTCVDHPKAANQIFLVSDDNDISTSEMVCEMAKALDKPTWQLPISVWCYKSVGKLFNKSDVVDRLIGSLQVDITHTKETLNWSPPQSLEEGFKETAQSFLQSKRK